MDPTGQFILNEKVRAKLLTVPAPLKIALLTKGQLSPTYTAVGEIGWSLVRFRIGNAAPENFEALDDLLAAMVEES